MRQCILARGFLKYVRIISFLSILTVVDWTDLCTVKNRETKCEGLSLALFLFAILGNVRFTQFGCIHWLIALLGHICPLDMRHFYG